MKKARALILAPNKFHLAFEYVVGEGIVFDAHQTDSWWSPLTVSVFRKAARKTAKALSVILQKPVSIVDHTGNVLHVYPRSAS